MATLLFIYHSRTGGTRHMVEAAASAAHIETEVRVLKAEDAKPADLLAADGYIFAGPENLAALSGAMKEIFDRCYYPLLGKIEGRPYSLMMCAGSDGENAVRQAARIATGWRLTQIQAPLIINTKSQTEAEILAPKTLSYAALAPCRDLGQAFGAGLSMGIF